MSSSTTWCFHAAASAPTIKYPKCNETSQRLHAAPATSPAENDPDEEELEFMRSIQLVHLAGEVELNGDEQDFALTSVYGKPRIILFDREDALESLNVMLARDEEGENDLLFLGSDFNDQSFMAYKRASGN